MQALPNGAESGIHQLVKVALSSMVALFGTYQIAANGVAIGMHIDLVFSGAIFLWRLKSRRWAKYPLIS